MRGATTSSRHIWGAPINFNPHSPCGERRWELCPVCRHRSNFNPHSPCGERLSLPSDGITCFLFQSTLPMRGATAKVTEFTLNLKTKFMTFGTKTNCETLQSSVSRICSNEKNYISQVRISKQFMIASHSHIYKISGSSGIYDALFPKCSTFFW